LPEEEKKESEKTRQVAVDLAKQSPPPEPVNVLPFQTSLKEGLTRPPPEPVEVSPFSQAKTTQSKQSENKKTEEQQ
jgi:hypothetical protein